jgi:hypothetical protein
MVPLPAHRSSTIAEPFYGYLPSDKEVDVFHPAAIVVMAVDNLPCEYQRMLVKALAPCLWSTLFLLLMTIKRVSWLEPTENGKLTPRFSYLQDFVDGK